MEHKAIEEIKVAQPFFTILSNANIKKNLRRQIIHSAPPEFFSVLTQAVRHLLNGTFCVAHPDYCSQYETALYLVALPTTSIADKQKILTQEPVEFVEILFASLQTVLP